MHSFPPPDPLAPPWQAGARRSPSGATLAVGLMLALLLAAAPAPPPPEAPAVRAAQRDTTEQDTTERDTTEQDTSEAATGRRRVRRIRVEALEPASPSPAALADTLEEDTLEADTPGAADTLHRVRRYAPGRGLALFPSQPGSGRTARLLAPRSSFWTPAPGTRYEHRLALDSTGRALTARERVGGETVAPPLRVGRSTYRRDRLRRDLRTGWADLRRQRRRRREQGESAVGVSINVPGGRESAFTTVFGKNTVSLDINGQADINAGFNYRRSDQQAQLTGSPTQLDPDFKQDLRLGITGSIGDKLKIDVNWDTQSQFDYQNQMKLRYTGYEDEIVQKVEAGNVFLDTPSQLIDGGQSLFGIKSQFQLGGLRLTTVASQQEGQSNTLSIEGGATRTDFDIPALRYDDRRHYFLGYYFRNNWERAHSDPQALITGINDLDRITELQVWRTKNSSDEQDEQVTALVDLGEPQALLEEADAYDDSTESALPATDNDQYEDPFVESLRADEAGAFEEVDAERTQTDFDYHKGEFVRLDEDAYTYDAQLGYLSLQQRLRDDEALAVAFRYRTTSGEIVQVGDFEGETGGERLVLKLLRPGNLEDPDDAEGSSGPAAWFLEMRNVYELRGRNIDAEGFELDLQYNPSGNTPQTTLQELGGQLTLLELLGLDRQDADGSPRSDGRFDFNARTIDRDEGLLFFPYLQPYGDRLRQVIENRADDGQQQTLLDKYVFPELYVDKRSTLQETSTEVDNYRIAGSSRGTAQEFYDLRAFNGVVENSVSVTSNGAALTEGADYQVDYQGGTVTITNESYLGPGSNIEIDYEKNALVNLQKKTLLGARADYRLRDNLRVGATLMRLSQRSPADKLRIGQEPIKNTIWGVDASLTLEPRWLTRAVDALPLVQTKAPSSLELTAEFAQLLPGHTETQAFERTRRRLQDDGRDFAGDELGGISYLDDFEGFENTFSLKSQVQNWRLAAPPDGSPQVPGAESGDALRANDSRGALTWYQLKNDVVEELSGVETYDEDLNQLVETRDVFPDRDTRGEVGNTLRTLDLYFDPARRGPYNYTDDLRGFVGQPQRAWGGMTQRLPEGQKDFGVKNIEFVEFVFKPYPKGGAAADSAALYLDLGRVSEDVVPNGEENNEDGLALTDFDARLLNRSRLPLDNRENRALDIEGGVTEDLGLDGLASYTGADTYGVATEEEQFGDFLDALPNGGSARLRAEAARARRDPSGDDYRFYEDDAFFENENLFPGGASFQERFLFYRPGLELNSFQAQNTLGAEFTSGRGNTRDPDAENFDFDQLNERGNYFQYRIPLNKEALDERARPNTPGDFIVGEIKGEGGEGTGWYQARVPVEAATRAVGSPDLSFIEHLRLWTTGHRAPMTLRFATLELVGSQWRASENVRLTDEPTDAEGEGDDAGDDVMGDGDAEGDQTDLSVASINNEEDSGIYQPPRRAVVGQQQVATGGHQNTREQSLVLRVEDLQHGQKRAIYKNVQSMNLLKYGGLRLFAHLHSATEDFAEAFADEAEARANGVELFVRIGSNETDDYYEYRQPLTPTLGSLEDTPVERLWYPLDAAQGGLANEMNLRLSALNQLKVARDQSDTPASDIFWSDENDVPLDPALGSFAPSGARLAVKGTPSLQDVSSLVIGLRAKGEGEGQSGDVRDRYEDLTLWVNELRATDYDERSGWKATASARIKLADFAEIRANFDRQTDGWGELASTLGQRRQNRLFNWRVQTKLYADKLLPGTAGWEIPITLKLGSRTSTPRYAPNRGDVLLSDMLAQAGASAGRPRGALRRAAQTYSAERGLNVRFSKIDSESPWLRYTLDNLDFIFTLSQRNARDPSRQVEDRWQWNADIEYRHSFDRARTVRPFGFLGDAPLIGALGDLRFNFAPQSVNFFSGLDRNTTQRQDRANDGLVSSPGDGTLREPIRDTHTFDHERRFEWRHKPFDFMRLSLSTRTEQSLNRIGAEERIRVVTPETVYDGSEDGTPETLFTNEEEATKFANERLGEDGGYLIERRLNMYGPGQSLGRLFGGSAARTNDYIQEFSASFDLPFGESEAMNWITFEDVSYDVVYGWQNGARGSNLGATASNDVNITSGITLHPQQFWRKFGFYRRLEKQQEAAEQEEPSEEPSGEEEPDEDDSDEDDSDEEGGEDDAGSERSFSDLPLPNPVGLLRRAALALTGMRDFSLQYDATRSAESSHVGFYEGENQVSDNFTSGSHTLLGALRGEGPSIGYRLGFGRRIGRDLRLGGDQYPLEDQLNDSNELTARTTLPFSEDFRVRLNWGMDWSRTSTYSNLGAGEDQTRTLTGSGTSSVWAFGGGYRAFFERQLSKLGETSARDTLSGAEVALTNASISEDFRRAFASSLGRVGAGGFLALPLPAWQVTYSGLSDWPLLRALTQSVRLTHGYNAEQSSDFRNRTTGNADATSQLDGTPYDRLDFEGRRLSVQERYQPLVGLEVSWKGALRTSVEWSRTNTFFTRPATAQVVEDRADELSVTADYRQQGLNLPFLPFGDLENQITFSLTASRTVERERNFLLRDALEEAALLEEPGSYEVGRALDENATIRSESTRLRVTPKLSYRFSNRISADFVVRYEQFEGNRRPSYSNVNGGFNVRVSLQQ